MKWLCVIMIVLEITVSSLCSASEWRRMESPHFLVYFTGAERDAATVIAEGEAFLQELENRSSMEFEGKMEVWICGSYDQFRLALNAPIQDWAVGAAFPESKRVFIRDPGFVRDRQIKFLLVLRHEIAHVVVGQKLGKNLSALPLWFNEGLAMYLSGEGMFFSHDYAMLSSAIWHALIPLQDLTTTFPQSAGRARLAYAESLSGINYIRKKVGDDGLFALVDLVALGESFNDAMTLVMGVTSSDFATAWESNVRRYYRIAFALSSSSIIWVLVTVGFLLVFVRYRRVRRRKLAEMEVDAQDVDEFFL